jgi:energy-coupling factor transport system permease protein
MMHDRRWRATLERMPSADRSRLHALAWTAWAAAAAVCVYTAPSAVYGTVILLACTLVVECCGGTGALGRTYGLFVAIGAIFGLVRVAITTLTTHGVGTALFRWPFAFTLPHLLGGFTLGGTFEREVLLQSLAEAYTITVFIAVFAAWNAVVSHHEALRAVPRAFHEPALVVTVAIAFVPSTLATLRAVQEAERARTGGAVRRRGALRRRIIPVLESGLERAVALAESMDARGLGHAPAVRSERTAAWTLLVALLSAAGALVALVSRASAAAVALFVVAGGTGAVAVVVGSRAQRRVRYRPRRFTGTDLAVIALSAIAPLGVAWAALADESSLHWTPSRLEVPQVSLGVVLALASLLAPLLTLRHARMPSEAVVGEPAWTH